MSRSLAIAAGWPAAELTKPGHHMGHRNVEVEAGLYVNHGRVWRICPTLLAKDKRHGQAHTTWPRHWRQPTLRDGKANPEFMSDAEGHDSNVFVYAPGSRPETDAEWPKCSCCGKSLVCSDGDAI